MKIYEFHILIFSQEIVLKQLLLHQLASLINEQVISTLLNQDVSYGFDLFVSIISVGVPIVPTRVGVIIIPSSTKPDSRVTGCAILLIVSKDTNSCF